MGRGGWFYTQSIYTYVPVFAVILRQPCCFLYMSRTKPGKKPPTFLHTLWALSEKHKRKIFIPFMFSKDTGFCLLLYTLAQENYFSQQKKKIYMRCCSIPSIDFNLTRNKKKVFFTLNRAEIYKTRFGKKRRRRRRKKKTLRVMARLRQRMRW